MSNRRARDGIADHAPGSMWYTTPWSRHASRNRTAVRRCVVRQARREKVLDLMIKTADRPTERRTEHQRRVDVSGGAQLVWRLIVATSRFDVPCIVVPSTQ